MKYIFLPGNSSSNREWIDRLAREFDTPKKVIHYSHWGSDKNGIDFNTELKKLANLSDEEYIVVAKSAGSVLALKAIEEGILNVKKCFFIGFPMLYISKLGISIKELLDNDVESVFIQKPKDYQIGFDELKTQISEIRNNSSFILYERDGEPDDNHHYADTQYLKEICISN
jgi:cobalamin biosynthesis Co2+ chelatase CbiK